MQSVFLIFKFFMRGGAQRDMVLAIRALQKRGVSVHILCAEAADPPPEGCQLTVLPVRGCSNHQRARDFEQQANKYLQEHNFDVAVGFSRMSGLDFYFAADDCLLERWRNPLLNRILPRRRTFLQQEAAALRTERIFTLTGRQEQAYQRFYKVSPERFTRVPPGIEKKYRHADHSADAREKARRKLGVKPDEILIVQAAASFHTKGVDRTLAMIDDLPPELKKRIRLIVPGDDKRRNRFQAIAALRNIAAEFPGGSDTLEELFIAADLMVHPARAESAGNVLIEAICSDLPVLTSRRCGFAEYISSSGGGVVLPEPFKLDHWSLALQKLLTEPQHLIRCRKNIRGLYKKDFWYSRAEVIADEIIRFIRSKKRGNK